MPPQRRTFTATAEQAGLTILAALRQWLDGASWSDVRKLLVARRVLVGEVLCLDESRRLHGNETVALVDRPLPPPPSIANVRLVSLDDVIVVVDKPSGMTTLRHAAERKWNRRRKQSQPALDDVLPDLIARSQGTSKARPRAGAPLYSVHRIDRETSGLLVFARTPHAREHLVAQFRTHTVERKYLAIAHGEVIARTFESFLIRDRGDGLRGSSARADEGKRAVTYVRPLEKLGDFTLIECRLETGRTHQIRIHLSEAGHPLLGDAKYTGAKSASGEHMFRNRDTLDGPRLALHAMTLGLVHPTTARKVLFQSPIPPDLSRVISALRK